MPKVRSIDTLPLDGGVLCFNFINTVYAWKGENLHEYLGTYEDVIKWSAKLQVLTTARRIELSALAKRYPSKAKRALQEMKKGRAILYGFFSALATHSVRRMPAEVIAAFNLVLSKALTRLQFYQAQNEVSLGWKTRKADLLEPLWVVMKSAYDILTTEDRLRIKECPRCGWLFIDHTKNNNRRWCNPATCGSTDKAKRYYRKKRSLQT